MKLAEIIDYAENHHFGEIHVSVDKATGLRAIIAIHSTTLGPALGGCRFLEYTSMQAALYDALRLANAMSYKAALAELSLGGGKAVIIQPEKKVDRQRLFSKFAEFVEHMGGRYITAEDSGTTIEDMRIISQTTDYVTGYKNDGDPAPYTAFGVKCSIEAAVAYQFGKTSLQNAHIAIQGVGSVGYQLAKLLNEAGAKLTVADINPIATQRCQEEFGADIVSPQLIHQTPCDIFAPCALGAVINDQSIAQLRTSIIAGSANNQLAQAGHGQALRDRGILYAPDYVANAGGLIFVAKDVFSETHEQTMKKINNIYHALTNIFQRADEEKKATNVITDTIAEEKLGINE